MLSTMKSSNLLIIFILLSFSALTWAAKPVDTGNSGGKKAATLSDVKSNVWDEAHVRRVLRAFAYGGLATEQQISLWANMKPHQAVAQILTFEFNNALLSPPEDDLVNHCGSLRELQEFISTPGPGNPLLNSDVVQYSFLGGNGELSETNMQRVFTLAVSTRGCNPFLYKMAFYLSNYHASIHVRSAGKSLIQQYFDDYLAALNIGGDFRDVMTAGASHAAVANAYRHRYNRIRADGTLNGNEDFAREYFQLFFGINGTGDPDYHENVSIKNNGRLLTGMEIDKENQLNPSSNTYDWYTSPINFGNHTDSTGRVINNEFYHYVYGNDNGISCLEILGEDICGLDAGEKLQALGPVAATHPESMENVPVKIINFFADDNLDADKIERIRGSWAAADFNLLTFLRKFAISRDFHSESTYKFFTTFDRNLITQNASFLSNQEAYSTPYWLNVHNRMTYQEMEIFEPIRNVFGHQTGEDAANNPFIYKKAFFVNTLIPGTLAPSPRSYTAADGNQYDWAKDWGSVIPRDNQGRHIASDVAGWLWNRFIGDGGKNFDSIARAQVQALLAEGVDFALTVIPGNPSPDTFFTSDEINGANLAAYDQDQLNAAALMDLDSIEGNRRIGLAINFISATPFAFAMEGL